MAKHTPPRPPRIFRATRESLGRVVRGAEITEAEAVAERQAGNDVVVCEGPLRVNRNLARRVENLVGSNIRQEPHESAGPYALPHFQQATPPPPGHCFYETTKRKAARNP